MNDQEPNPKTEVLKTRDDPEPIRLVHEGGDEVGGSGPRFRLADEQQCGWMEPEMAVGPDTLRRRIEPWLTALCQAEHLSLLVGSGLTHAIHFLAQRKPGPGMEKVNLGGEGLSAKVRAAALKSADALGRGEGNLEDELRVALELLRGLEILAEENQDESRLALAQGVGEALTGFAENILACERGIANPASDGGADALRELVTFLMSFASRSAPRDRLHVFTTNYDRLIEAGADLAGLRLMDRFVGGLSPRFRSSRLDLDLHYNPPGIRGEPRPVEGVARFTKLHGSVDWIQATDGIRRMGVPFGAPSLKPHLEAFGVQASMGGRLMVYPNSAKDRETAGYPYVDLHRDFAAASCRPNHVLVTYGYSFGDEHLNRVVEDMLTIPSCQLVVITRSDGLGRVMDLYRRTGRGSQISLLVGEHLADLRTLNRWYLPKASIDLSSARMADLLRLRATAIDTEPRGRERPEERKTEGE